MMERAHYSARVLVGVCIPATEKQILLPPCEKNHNFNLHRIFHLFSLR